jgi:hypothetical protein
VTQKLNTKHLSIAQNEQIPSSQFRSSISSNFMGDKIERKSNNMYSQNNKDSIQTRKMNLFKDQAMALKPSLDSKKFDMSTIDERSFADHRVR